LAFPKIGKILKVLKSLKGYKVVMVLIEILEIILKKKLTILISPQGYQDIPSMDVLLFDPSGPENDR